MDACKTLANFVLGLQQVSLKVNLLQIWYQICTRGNECTNLCQTRSLQIRRMQTCKPKANLINKFTKDLRRAQFFGKLKISPRVSDIQLFQLR